jgi:hypothetical protein
MKKRDPKPNRGKSRKKKFDCVKMKHRIQAKIYQEIKHLTREEELEYWRKGAEHGPWGDWWKQIHKRRQHGTEKPSVRVRRRKSG